MTFEEWREQIINAGRPGWIRPGPNLPRMCADWAAEREKLIGALEKAKGWLKYWSPSEAEEIATVLAKVKEKV